MATSQIEAYRVVEDSDFSLLIGLDTATGRACFHRARHP